MSPPLSPIQQQEQESETLAHGFAWQSARLPRQPHAGSTLLVIGLFVVSLLVTGTCVVLVGRKLHWLPPGALAPYGNPVLSIVIEFVAYATTAIAAYPLLRAFWQRPVSSVLEMNWPEARRRAVLLVGSGLLLAVVTQLAASRMSLPKEMPIDNFFHSSVVVWLMAIFGTLLAPVVEEIFFRGFLLKTFAIAFDWTRQFFGEEERRLWRETEHTSLPAWIVGAVISSAAFGAMHAAQLGGAWNVAAVLSVVGLILSFVRIRLQSVWASSLLHMGYNGLLFIALFFATDGYRHLDKLKR